MPMNNEANIQRRESGEVSWAHYWLFGNANTHFIETLKNRAPKEVACALAASLLVSPLVSIIDKCIVQDISGTNSFMRAVGTASKEMVMTPKVFFGSLAFRLTFVVYSGTYAVANLSEAIMDARRIRGKDKRKQIKVAAASVANISLLSWRDSVFARVYAAPRSVPRAITPMRTIGLFAARDASTMYATFYLAPRAADYLRKEHGMERNAAALCTALAIPMITQFATAPLHIHAMDYYQNRAATFAERMDIIRNEYGKVSFARGFRILPAFGIGSFSNNKFRELFIRQEDEGLLLQRRLTRLLEETPSPVPASAGQLFAISPADDEDP